MDDILQNQNIVPAQFDIQHHDNPSSRNQTLRDLVQILLATVTPPVHALPMGLIPFRLGAGVLQVEPVRWSLVVQYGVDGDGWVRVYITQTSSSWIDQER